MLGSSHLTSLSDETKMQTENTKPGMAFFAYTGPHDKTCGDCVFRGYARLAMKETFNTKTGEYYRKSYRSLGCRKFKELAGKNGPAVDKNNRSCKYFEAKKKKS